MSNVSAILHAHRSPAILRRAVCFRRFVHFTLYIVHFFLCCAVCRAEWAETNAPVRVAGMKGNGEDRYVLVDVPARDRGREVSELKGFGKVGRCAVKVVYRTEETLTALVDVREVERDGVFYVYALTGGPAAVVAAAEAEPFDGRPLRAEGYRMPGQEVPEELAAFLLMTQRRDRRSVLSADCSNFEEVTEKVLRRRGGGNWDRPMQGVEVETWMVASEPGRYQFWLRNGGGAFLLVDGEVVARKEDEPGNSQRFSGEPVTLGAGVHRVAILTAGKRNFAAVEMGWKRVERREEDEAGSVLLVTGGSYVTGRVERRDEPEGLFAAALLEVGDSYTFDDCNAVFYPLQMKAFVENLGGGEVTLKWTEEGRGIELGDKPRVWSTVAETGRVTRVALEARRSDGRVARTVGVAPVSGVAMRAHVAESRLEGVPAYAFAGDEVRPEVHLRLSVDERLPFDVEAVIRGKEGERRVRERVSPERTWGRMALPPVKIGAAESVTWQVLHAGVLIEQGEWRCVDADSAGALRVVGDRLMRGDADVTLVGRRAWQGSGSATRRGGELVILDGSGSSGQGAWRSLADFGDAEGSAALRPFAGIATLPEGARVAVIPPMEDVREAWQREAQLRWMSAFCGALRGAGHEVALVAMPERCHAEMVFVVADAYGLSVADAYSDFKANPPANRAARIEALIGHAFGERMSQ